MFWRKGAKTFNSTRAGKWCTWLQIQLKLLKLLLSHLREERDHFNDQEAKLRSLIGELSQNYRNEETCHIRVYDEKRK